MINLREELIDILNGVLCVEDITSSEEVADHLIESGVTIEEWISVTERLPSEEDLERSPFHTFLVISSGEVKEAVYNDLGKYFAKHCGRLYGVTHWKPMPEPPIKQEESK